MTTIVLVAGLIFLLNLPFGYWRSGVRKFSPAWFVAVHAPVPLAIGMRYLAGMGFRLATLPIYIAAFFLGQMAGGRWRKRLSPTV
ncbi:MAG TPA: hypothetical protein VF862_11025 [Gemmatimonadales bacterium]